MGSQFNLSWKLALVERGVAPPSLLSSYSEERLPVIKRMIEETKTIFRVAMLAPQPPKPTAKTNNVKAPWDQWSEELKQLGVNYRWSSILVDERHGADDAGAPSSSASATAPTRRRRRAPSTRTARSAAMACMRATAPPTRPAWST